MPADLCDPLLHILYYLVSSSHDSDDRPSSGDHFVEVSTRQDIFSLVTMIYENVVIGLKAASRFPLGYFSLWELKY